MGNSSETFEDFYKHKFDAAPKSLSRKREHFNVFRMEEILMQNRKTPVKYTRRNFYKISLIRGHSLFHYADKSIETSGSTLIFFNPQVPHTWEPLSDETTGFLCIFNEVFFTDNLRINLKDLPMFIPGNKPSYELQNAQSTELERIFENILTNLSSAYRLKYDLIRNYIVEILHFALKMQPSESVYQHYNANARITSVFMDLLERQFSIEVPHQQPSLRSPRDFADKLSVHVNHLNRAIKETTGKTTSNFIAERVVTEAKALLKHSSWNISEISYSLGFEDIAHFDNFFKKQTLITPSAYRIEQ